VRPFTAVLPGPVRALAVAIALLASLAFPPTARAQVSDAVARLKIAPDLLATIGSSALPGVPWARLLDGELLVDDKKLYPGDYLRSEPGTMDRRVWSETGCTCVLLTSFRDVIL